jgi:cell division protein ZapA
MKRTHLVTVLGRELSVRSSAPAEKVHAVEMFVNERLNDIGAALKSGDAALVLTLALLNTAEELLDLRAAQDAGSLQDDRLREILAKLESA